MEHFIKGFGLNQYINRLPDKENTIFNLFSDDISGGEKQIEKKTIFHLYNFLDQLHTHFLHECQFPHELGHDISLIGPPYNKNDIRLTEFEP